MITEILEIIVNNIKEKSNEFDDIETKEYVKSLINISNEEKVIKDNKSNTNYNNSNLKKERYY